MNGLFSGIDAQRLVFALIYISVSVLLYGKILDIIVYSPVLEFVGRIFMRFIRLQKFIIQACFCWFAYLFTGFVLSAAGLLIFRPDVTVRDFFSIDFSKLPIVLVAFFGQMTLAAMILLLIKGFSPHLEWNEIIGNVGWIKVSKRFPRAVRIIYPMSSAFFEEILFRGVMFSILLGIFKNQGIWIPLIIVTIAFCVEQILNTQTIIQGIGLAVGSAAISAIGCMLVIATGSYFSAILTHMMFALFYVEGYSFS